MEGAWAWIRHDDGRWGLDYRTKDYWPAGTQIHVSAQLYGVQLAPGAYGAADITSDFTIGRNQVVLADANSHNLVVQQDGVTVATYDASYGSGDDIGDPNRVTRSGTHIVMGKEENTLMSNPAYGYSNVPEKWAVRISDNGEFIHQNQYTVADQGVVNVSHGCINLSAESAQAYFESAIYGDPVAGHRDQRAAVRGRRRHLRLGAELGPMESASLSPDRSPAVDVPLQAAPVRGRVPLTHRGSPRLSGAWVQDLGAGLLGPAFGGDQPVLLRGRHRPRSGQRPSDRRRQRLPGTSRGDLRHRHRLICTGTGHPTILTAPGGARSLTAGGVTRPCQAWQHVAETGPVMEHRRVVDRYRLIVRAGDDECRAGDLAQARPGVERHGLPPRGHHQRAVLVGHEPGEPGGAFVAELLGALGEDRFAIRCMPRRWTRTGGRWPSSFSRGVAMLKA